MSGSVKTLQPPEETIRQLHAELEQTNREVMALTLELEQRVDALRAEVAEREKAERARQAQVDRLKLLNQITRAMSERQDLGSILQVTVRSLEEHLPLDFACVGLHDPNDSTLTVASAGRNDAALKDIPRSEDARIPIDSAGLSRCLRGEFVYQPETTRTSEPLAQRLASVGLHALVMAPLRAENTVFGVVVAARRKLNGFSDDELEFLRQVSEHAGLAAHQAKLHGALARAYEDLRQTQEAFMQQERLRALGQLAGGVAHDINNALSPAAIYAQTLLQHDPSLSPEAREYLTVIQRAIESVAHTVGRMRMFSRPREAELTLSHIDLDELLREAAVLTRAKWQDMPQERGVVIQLKTELAANLPHIMGAANEIGDALTNLIFNAVDAMPDGGTLTLRSKMKAGSGTNTRRHVYVEVCDTGVGMPEAVRSRCLEPFFTTKGERGTGLGLAMVYGMVQRHGAELEIESEPGQGTNVRLIFPVATESEVAKPPAPADQAVSLRILLVDDDPVLLKSLNDVLKSEGHLVTAADGGQSGIERFLQAHEHGESFDVVITDLGMPNVDGRTVAAAIKATAPATPVVLLTGWGQRLREDLERPADVDRVLAKPPRLSELRTALWELVNPRKS